MHGHLAARLDPLGSEPVGDPALEPERLIPKLTPELQARIPASLLRLYVPAETLADALPRLQETYCGTIAYEIEHISDHERRVWLRQAIESGKYRRPLDPGREDAAARAAHRGRGLRALPAPCVPRPEAVLDRGPRRDGADARRGDRARRRGRRPRGRDRHGPPRAAERPRAHDRAAVRGDPARVRGRADDRGGRRRRARAAPATSSTTSAPKGVRKTPSGEITVTLCANPSHLEAVDPVVEGRTRAEQTDRSTRAGVHDPGVALPILIHGDASFAGQGVVAETLNLEGLAGYTTGGTLHLIANNQIGFTTDPAEGRSTRYSSDLAKGFDIPIIHVNADDPEAAISAIRLALAFRAPVRPRRRRRPRRLPPLRPQRAGRAGVHPAADGAADRRRTRPCASSSPRGSPEEGVDHRRRGRRARRRGSTTAAQGAHERLKATFGQPEPHRPSRRRSPRPPPRTGSSRPSPPTALRALDRSSSPCPSTSRSTRSSRKQLERRTVALDEGGIDWGHAESLAFAQPARRGDSRPADRPGHRARHVRAPPPRPPRREHRRALRADPAPRRGDRLLRGAQLAALRVRRASASSTATRSPRRRRSCSGRRSSATSSTARRSSSTSSSSPACRSGGRRSRLTLLLPHGYEGNGPEHSSARLERFLQSTAQDNIRVANPSTAAQYFHLLRRQALEPVARPLVVMTPKGLLRLREATSTLADLADGSFEPVIDDRAHRQGAHTPARPLLGQGLLRHRRPRGACRRRGRSPSPGSSSSIRSRRPSWPLSSPRTRT